LLRELTSEDEALKKQVSRIDSLKQYLLSKETIRGLLALTVLAILDGVIAVVAAAFMSRHVLLLLSNLLFLEGALIFTVGSFIAFARTSPRRKEKKKTEETKDAAQVSEERLEKYVTGKPTPVRMPLGPLLILLGLILIALSVVALQILRLL
jgi:hypothetical protein